VDHASGCSTHNRGRGDTTPRHRPIVGGTGSVRRSIRKTHIPVYPHARRATAACAAALPLDQALANTRATPSINIHSILERVCSARRLRPPYDVCFVCNDEKARVRTSGGGGERWTRRWIILIDVTVVVIVVVGVGPLSMFAFAVRHPSGLIATCSRLN